MDWRRCIDAGDILQALAILNRLSPSIWMIFQSGRYHRHWRCHCLIEKSWLNCQEVFFPPTRNKDGIETVVWKNADEGWTRPAAQGLTNTRRSQLHNATNVDYDSAVVSRGLCFLLNPLHNRDFLHEIIWLAEVMW